ncbi:MAG: hypothetical protein AB2A00_33625 [Myxococcota bacterium]
MSALQDRLKDVEKAEGNADAVDEARRRLVEELEGDPAAAPAVTEALYRLGLSTLWRKRDLAAASDLFKRAAEKKDPTWSPVARTSYALTLHAKQKYPQAVFELRKVIGSGAPTPATTTALCMLCQVLRDSGAKPSEIEKADKERIAALDAMVKQAPAGSEELAQWRVMLAVAHKEGGSRSECKKQLEAVVAMGNAAGDALASARELLKGM